MNYALIASIFVQMLIFAARAIESTNVRIYPKHLRSKKSNFYKKEEHKT